MSIHYVNSIHLAFYIFIYFPFDTFAQAKNTITRLNWNYVCFNAEHFIRTPKKETTINDVCCSQKQSAIFICFFQVMWNSTLKTDNIKSVDLEARGPMQENVPGISTQTTDEYSQSIVHQMRCLRNDFHHYHHDNLCAAKVHCYTPIMICYAMVRFVNEQIDRNFGYTKMHYDAFIRKGVVPDQASQR